MIIGYRTWAITAEGMLTSITARTVPWSPETNMHAKCFTELTMYRNKDMYDYGLYVHDSSAPDINCSCGIHAYGEDYYWTDLYSNSYHINGCVTHKPPPCPAAVGLVALWGKIIEHKKNHMITGYRAEHARILGVYSQRCDLGIRDMFSRDLCYMWDYMKYPGVDAYHSWTELETAMKEWSEH